MISIHEQQTTNGHRIGWLTLDLPRTLNALTLDMASSLRAQLAEWASQPDIACVVMQGAGRAFCAGGDVRRMRQGILDGDDYCERFFEQEYRLDHEIHLYPKPLLCWGHGVVMGGGVGLMIGASHRVVTESSRLAMPETSIGLYPDVGASYFLNRLPAGLGLFLGITGCEWNGADAVAMGMADYLLQDSCKAELPALLANLPWSADAQANKRILNDGLQGMSHAEQPQQLWRYAVDISAICSGSWPACLTQLQAMTINEPWFTHAMENLQKGCPVTACIVAEQLQRGRSLSLAEVFCMEWVLSIRCTQHPDFAEGVRAQLVDKDKNPQWTYRSITDVPADYIARHFIDDGLDNPLANPG